MPALVKALDGGNHSAHVARALAAIGEPSIEPLAALLISGSEDQRFFSAEALSRIEDRRAAKALDSAADRGDLHAVAGGVDYFLDHPSRKVDALLIEALKARPNAGLAQRYLNDGSANVAEAGRAFLEAGGYEIIEIYTTRQ